MTRNRQLERWAPWLLAVVIVIVWQAICSIFDISDFIFPSPIQIVRSLVEHARAIAGHAWQTFWTTMAGFALGVAVGLALGILVGTSRMVYSALYPLLVAFNSIPKAAFVPILVVWFGIGTVPAILTAFLICFFPIVVNVATGLATLEP
jgi:NitT/TauT family transport system permease protein